MRNRIFAVALWFALPGITAAQTQEIKVGDSQVHGERLQPYTNQWQMKVVKPDGTILEDAGTWTDQLEAVSIDGKQCWKRTQSATFKRKTGEVAATTKTVNVFDVKTMAPVSREFERHIAGGDDSKSKITFHHNSMMVENTEKGKSEVHEVGTSSAYDFYGGVYALLWVAIPLKPNFSASFPSYTEDEHPELVQQVTYKITGQDNLETKNARKVDTWLIESDTSIGYLKYWISEKPPYILRMDFKDKTGAMWTLTTT